MINLPNYNYYVHTSMHNYNANWFAWLTTTLSTKKWIIHRSINIVVAAFVVVVVGVVMVVSFVVDVAFVVTVVFFVAFVGVVVGVVVIVLLPVSTS